jgi:hypothetical protein
MAADAMGVKNFPYAAFCADKAATLIAGLGKRIAPPELAK